MAGYTRQDSANVISNGSVIDATVFDAEYDALAAAFNATTGHDHSGAAGEGSPITVVGPAQDLVVTATEIRPKTASVLTVGTSLVPFEAGYFSGALSAAALSTTGAVSSGSFETLGAAQVGTTLSVAGATTLSGNVDLGSASTNTVTFFAEIDSSLTPNTTDTYNLGSATKKWASLHLSGAATVGSLTATTVDINGGAIDGTIVGGTSAAAVTGTTITANTGFVGNLTGNSTGTHTGAVVGTAVSASSGFTGNLTGNVTGNVTGTVSSLSNLDSDDLTEGAINLYYTNSRARAAISVSDAGGDGSLSYNSSTGAITYTGPSATEVRSHFSAGTGISISSGVVSGTNASTSAKGVAQFDATDFIVTNGVVEFNDNQIKDVVGAMVTAPANTESGIVVTYQGDRTIDFDVNDFTITLSGDVAGAGTVTDLSNVTITTTVQPNSVALGTDTTGNYVSSLVAGTGVTLANNSGEGATPTVSIGQDVATSATPSFAGLTVDNASGDPVEITGDLVVLGTTTTTNTATLEVTAQYVVVNDGQASPALNGGIEVDRGTGDNQRFEWGETADRWRAISVTGGTLQPIEASTFYGALSGNASTASALQTARTISLTGDVTGSVSFNGSANVSIATTVAANSVALGTDTTGNYIATGAVTGNGLSGSASAEGATFTVSSNATHLNTPSTIVFRDSSGNFSAGTITAALSGNASTATLATTATNANNVYIQTQTLSQDYKIPFANTIISTSGNYGLLQDSTATFTYNPSNNTLKVGTVAGNLTGNVTGNVTGDVTGNASTATTLVGLNASVAELNILDGVTATTAEINILDGVTATAAELNKLDGVTATTAELNILDGVTATAAEINLLDGSASNTVVNGKAVVYGASGQVQATTVDLGDWTISQSGSDLKFSYGGVDRFKLTSTGDLTVEGNVTAYGSA